jgi:hypothetical protein
VTYTREELEAAADREAYEVIWAAAEEVGVDTSRR